MRNNLVRTPTRLSAVYCCAEYFPTGLFPLVTSETHGQVDIPKPQSVILHIQNFGEGRKTPKKIKSLASIRTAYWKCQQLCCLVFFSLSVVPLPLWRRVRVKVQTAAAANVAECQAPIHPINHYLVKFSSTKKKRQFNWTFLKMRLCLIPTDTRTPLTCSQ